MSDSRRPLSFFDRPNSYIGRSVPRPNARRLLQGRGRFVDDIALPRMLHAAFARSPYAHARIKAIDIEAAKAAPGVAAVLTGVEIAAHCTPWVGVLSNLAGLKSAPQHALAIDRACWQGEPIVIVAAESRALAEDAAALIEVDWQELPVVADMATALDPQTPAIHPELGDNLAWRREVEAGDVEKAFAAAATVIEETFEIGRHTGVTLEPRALVAEFDPAERRLTVHHSGQGPHMMQALFAKHLGLPEADVRVISRDVGGSFGIKIHTYGDEMATATLAMLLGRPIKFIADRLESFVTDIHAREHRITARMALDADGAITAIAFDDLTGIGPYSAYPRTSAVEANQVLNLTGAHYACPNYRARAQVVLLNKGMTSQYRAVGHPIAVTIAEGLADSAAAKLGIDPVDFRRRNLVRDDAYPCTSASGMPFEGLSHHACLDKLVEIMDYPALRAEQQALRTKRIHRGIGLATFIEITSPSPLFYGAGGAPISAQDGCTLRLEPSGAITCAIGVTEQGQGTEAIIAQIAATAIGVPMAQVRVLTGDTDNTPYGGGTWGSRGAAIGGEATLQAGKALRANILDVAAVVLQANRDDLDIVDGIIVTAADGTPRLPLADLARQVQYRGAELPDDLQPEFVVTRHYRLTGQPFAFTNGIQASYVEVDTETGFLTLLKHWVVEDCGTVINPQLVDEQIRGGVVQGIGSAIGEHCVYSEEGQLLGGTLADYLVPMAAEMPDIVVAHVSTPTAASELGAKGAGEAGTGGAPAAVMNAVNDALRPLNAHVTQQPITPAVVLAALGIVPAA